MIEEILSDFEFIFEYVLRKRIVSFIDKYLESILDEKNFTHLYREEVDGENVNIRPIYDVSDYAFHFIALLIDEFESEEFKNKFYMEYLPSWKKNFFLWLKLYLETRNLKFIIKRKNLHTDKYTTYIFFTQMTIDYPKIINDFYEQIL